MTKVAALILSFVFCLGLTQANDKCYAAVLQGGGDKGAYQAGALQCLASSLPKGEAEWQVFSGVSVGAINALFAGVYSVGDETKMTEDLVNIWKGIKDRDVYKNWIGGVVNGALFKAGLFNNAPLRDTLKKHSFKQTLHRDVFYGICNADKANFEVHEYKEDEEVDLLHIESVMASAAIPAMFPPVIDPRDGDTLIDGGAIWNVDLPSAIRGCRARGYEDKDIVVDIILCGGAPLATKESIAEHNTY